MKEIPNSSIVKHFVFSNFDFFLIKSLISNRFGHISYKNGHLTLAIILIPISTQTNKTTKSYERNSKLKFVKRDYLLFRKYGDIMQILVKTSKIIHKETTQSKQDSILERVSQYTRLERTFHRF